MSYYDFGIFLAMRIVEKILNDNFFIPASIITMEFL